MSEELNRQNALTRRSVVKGAAWSMPVIATAIAAPLASASNAAGDVDLGVSFTGASLDLRQNLLDGLDAWYNNLPSISRLAAAIPYAALHAAVAIAGNVVNIGFDYPSHVIITNIDSKPLAQGESVGLTLNYQNDVVNLTALNQLAGVNLIETGSGATGSVTSAAQIPPAGVVAAIGMSYNPISLNINLAGANQEPANAVALLSGDSPSDSGNGDTATSPLGLKLELLPGLATLVSTLNGIVTLPTITIDIFS